jgi:hypothetical protein
MANKDTLFCKLVVATIVDGNGVHTEPIGWARLAALDEMLPVPLAQRDLAGNWLIARRCPTSPMSSHDFGATETAPVPARSAAS